MYVWDLRSHTHDPRLEWDPDAAVDTNLWQTVLSVAEEHCRKTCYILWFFRQLGAKLVVKNNKLRMVPVLSNDLDVSEWKTFEDYERDRQRWLLAHTETVKAIFTESYEKIRKSA